MPLGFALDILIPVTILHRREQARMIASVRYPLDSPLARGYIYIEWHCALALQFLHCEPVPDYLRLWAHVSFEPKPA